MLNAVDVWHGAVQEHFDLAMGLLLFGSLGATMQDHVELLGDVCEPAADVSVEGVGVQGEISVISFGETVDRLFQWIGLGEVAVEQIFDARADSAASVCLACVVARLHGLREVARVQAQGGVKLDVAHLLRILRLVLVTSGLDTQGLGPEDVLETGDGQGHRFRQAAELLGDVVDRALEFGDGVAEEIFRRDLGLPHLVQHLGLGFDEFLVPAGGSHETSAVIAILTEECQGGAVPPRLCDDGFVPTHNALQGLSVGCAQALDDACVEA